MNLIFSSQAWEDYLYWQETDRRMVRRPSRHRWLRAPEA